jgi:sigma-B regulation protein RsbU (phosphoserine phosphatase)
MTDALDDLLDDVRDRIGADTVVILLLDRAGTHLVARAARGLEEEVQQGVRVPLGAGFAGRVASTRAPVVLDDVGPDTVVNPILWEKGVRAMLGVPLSVGDRLLGVLHVGRLHPRGFVAPDVAALQATADRIADQLVVHETAAERMAARTLQESLLPAVLPSVDGLEFASRFVPAEDFGVGGDWFDAFELPDGRIGIAMGDVAGSGLRAAVVMGRMRSVLRAYAIETDRPSEALERLDRKFAHFEPDEMATVLYLTIDADLTRFTVASAGHPPPVLAEVGGDVSLVDCAPGPPIGAHVGARRVDVDGSLAPGSALACYTDGLIERRLEPVDEGLERLRRSFRAGPADAVCRVVMRDLIGSSMVEDDTALLVVRRLG